MNMISRKTEERNEKIVRGLLKLPPNRRCINCDSLGPQYVCTNFWTFICTTCSGIHREFTHRVKSISMSKFTTEEVEALQNGGNQRARELYLKGWDFQIQRLPTSSNVEKIREFIKNTYLDKKYVAAKVSDTPTDYQSSRSRASSYHSYSQSPPYDHQYEERKYGKRAPVLTRKSGSERNLHIENLSSFSYSTTGMSEKANAKRYANEDSISRHSLRSETSVGDPFRSDVTSPSSCSNHGFSSPFSQDSIEWNSSTVMEEDARRDGNKVPRPQRALSAGSFGSYGRDSVSSYSFHSDSQVTKPEHNRTVGGHQSDILSVPSAINSGTLDLFANQVVLQPVASSTVDFFQLPTTSTSTFIIPHTSTFDSHMLPNLSQSPITPSPYVNQFGNNSPDLPFLTDIDPASSEVAIPKSEGWATFDKVPVDSSLRVPLGNAPHKYDTVPTFSEKTNESLQFENKVQAYNVDAGSYPTVPSPWSDVMQQQTFTSPTFSQTQWSAFDDPMGHTQWGNIPLKVKPYYAMSTLSAESNQYMSFITEGLNGSVTSGLISENVPPFSDSFYQRTSSDLNSDHQPYSVKYTNPFDLPFDLDSDSSKELLNMNSLRASLPSEFVFRDEFADPWKSHYPVTTLPIQANIPFKAAESQPSHFMDVSPHGPITSIGGNPFA